jgi:transposase
MAGGRPTKLTPDLMEKFIPLLRAGNYLETAAAFVGIDRQTAREWIKRGERASAGIYREFSTACERAMAESEIRDLEDIRKDEDWQAKAWRLERRLPHKWGRHDRLDVNTEPTVLKIVVDDGRNDPPTA